MNNLLLFIVAVFFSLFLSELIRRYALKFNLLDNPNERSSHSLPTPRGGGLAIVVTFLVAVNLFNPFSGNIILAFTGAGILVAAIGFWDDQGHIAAKWRLLSHFIASTWVLYWLGGLPEFQLLGFNIDAGWAGMIIIAFLLVWTINLFNFMDGIDGLAAVEVIFISCGAAYISWLNGLESSSFLSFLLAASTTGFLILNWPPAKIFMGDVGSGFLGLTLGIIAYANILQGGTVWVWLILAAVFLVDSGVTLLKRILQGDKWYEAHCSHAYQHAARKWGHKKVTISVLIINLFWLLPLATFAQLKPNMGFLLTLLTFVPLIIVAIKYKAGITDTINSTKH